MNTKLERQFIDSLKRSNFDRLEFHENDENKIIGFSYYYNNECPCGLDFEQDGKELILIDRFSIRLYDFPLYFYLKRGAEDRNDIQRVLLNVLGECGQMSEIRYVVNLDNLNEETFKRTYTRLKAGNTHTHHM